MSSSSAILNAQATSTVTPGGDNKPQAAPTDRTSVAPPENIRTKFESDFPGKTEVRWKVEKNNFKVMYTDPETKLGHVIVYDKDGKVMRKENEVDKLTYPSSINDYYSKKYPKESFEVWQTEIVPGETRYFIKRKNKTLWFDQSGKLIQENRK